MLEREISMLQHYRRYADPNYKPDGSFMMISFIQGWDAAIRYLRKRGE